MTIQEFWETIYPLLLNRTIEKVEKTLTDGTKIKAYWVVNIIRVDIQT